MSERHLYEILVPRSWADNDEIDVEYHRLWDEKIRGISGGLTVMHPAKGQWVHQGKLHAEEMIPCRILATREEMDKIVDVTLAHYYDQKCVLAYRLSTEVIERYRSV
jgi:hypothetical protein